MWLAYAFGSAFFAGITAVLAKIGIEDVDSTLATALRTIIVLFFTWLMAFWAGSLQNIADISLDTFCYLIVSGLCTGLSWLCYFKALQLGDVNKVAPIDKSSTVLTIILAFVFLGETVSIFKFIGCAGIGIGTLLMITKNAEKEGSKHNRSWVVFALCSALFASLTSLFGKIGIDGVESNLGTAIRTVVVLLMAWVMVFIRKKQHSISRINMKSWFFLLFSGVTTGMSWLCYYKALQDGEASLVVPIDKLSIIITIAFSSVILKERLSGRAICGLCMIIAGTMIMLF